MAPAPADEPGLQYQFTTRETVLEFGRHLVPRPLETSAHRGSAGEATHGA